MNYALLSKYRGELMGAAMLFVILFHVWLPKSHMFYSLHKCGNVGVDMFLFLSGIGLWFSWTKDSKPSTLNSKLLSFYRRRLLRIYPAWLIIAALYYIPNYLNAPNGGYSPDIPNLIANIAVGWSFWRIDDLTFWFVPAIMMLYVFAPFYMMLIQKNEQWRWLPVVFLVWMVMVQYMPPVHAAVGHVEIFWSRIPIFLLGINCGELVRTAKCDDNLKAGTLILLLITFAMSLAMCMELEQHWRGRFPLFLERMVYIPLSVSAMLLLCQLFLRAPHWILRGLAFVGTVSLELYLIHIEFVYKKITQYHLGYCLNFLITFGVGLLLAWILHKVVSKITSKI
ncbi:MAG: acyltransferase [Prevotella sp.]|nr:acyltransferase [Prevotella sp.]